MHNLQFSQLEVLAPDEGVLTRAKALASPNKWSSLGKISNSIWGACIGSNQRLYHSQASLQHLQSSCNCPSRLRPCKHVIGLLWLFVKDPTIFGSNATPDWVSHSTTTSHTSNNLPLSKELDQEAKKKRATARLQNIRNGAEELEKWLYDAIKHGTAELFQEEEVYWDHWRARMIDAQAPGLASRVEQIRDLFRRDDWPARTLDAMGELYLLLRGIQRLPQLSADLQQELISQVGISTKKADILDQAGIQDQWIVIGRTVEIGERIDVSRTWLFGCQSRRFALHLDFAVGQRSFTHIWSVGTCLDAELVFYPGRYPLRAEFKTSPEWQTEHPRIQPTSSNWNSSLTSYSQALASNPFLSQFPLLMDQLSPNQHQEHWGLTDSQGRWVPIQSSFRKIWEMIALSGGHPMTTFGEWNGHSFLPLGILHEGKWVGL